MSIVPILTTGAAFALDMIFKTAAEEVVTEGLKCAARNTGSALRHLFGGQKSEGSLSRVAPDRTIDSRYTLAPALV